MIGLWRHRKRVIIWHAKRAFINSRGYRSVIKRNAAYTILTSRIQYIDGIPIKINKTYRDIRRELLSV